jgi:hypothetical protein
MSFSDRNPPFPASSGQKLRAKLAIPRRMAMRSACHTRTFNKI